MKRSLFFWITAILALLFGGLMFITPPGAAQTFGLAESTAGDVVFRILGATLLGIALLNFLVRNHADSETLAAVLWTNVAVHGLGLIADISSVVAGRLTVSSVAFGVIVHLFVGIGSLIYATRMRPIAVMRTQS
jgi:hypothetical protein